MLLNWLIFWSLSVVLHSISIKWNKSIVLTVYYEPYSWRHTTVYITQETLNLEYQILRGADLRCMDAKSKMFAKNKLPKTTDVMQRSDSTNLVLSDANICVRVSVSIEN